MLQSVGKSFDPKAEARRFTLFVVLGGCAALVNWVSRFPLERIVSFPMSVAMAYMIGMVVAFTLFSQFVFPVSPQPLAQHRQSARVAERSEAGHDPGDFKSADAREPPTLLRPCPCGRTFVIEIFARGCEPRCRPATAPPVIRIDRS